MTTTLTVFNVRPMTFNELEKVVEIHMLGLKSFFLSTLGPRFLHLLYRGIWEDQGGIVLVAESGEGIVGFVAGVMKQEAFFRCLLANKKWYFALAALRALARRPCIAPRLLRALTSPRDSRKSAAEACMMSIAVKPEFEGQGIGQALVRRFCHDLYLRGVRKLCLTTDSINNDRTNRFYQKLGFKLMRSFTTPEGRRMNEYIIQSSPCTDERWAYADER